MNKPILYRGQWPQNVSKTAKYAVKIVEGKWKVTVSYDLGEGLMFLAVESGDTEIAERVNQIKRTINGQEGGSFYINEYQHLIVPVESNGTSHYYFGGKVECEFKFVFEGNNITSKPFSLSGGQLSQGDAWIGPRPAIPYVLAANGKDIYFKSPALTATSPAEIRPGVIRKVELSKVLKDRAAVMRATQPILEVRGYGGGRFYVNEHRAIFTPVDKGDGNGLNYLYCGQVDLTAWFPEPPMD